MTRNTNPYREKGLSVFLAALMVLSVVAMSAVFVAPAAATHDPAAADRTVTEDQDPRVWQGNTVVFDFSTNHAQGDTFEITGEEELGEFSLDADGHSPVFDTTGWAAGDYEVRDQDTGDIVTEFRVRVQPLDASFADNPAEQNSETTLTLDSSRSGPYNVTITSTDEKLEGSELASIFDDATIESQGANSIEVSGIEGGPNTATSLNANLAGLEVDEYDLAFDVTDTTGSDSVTLNVTEETVEPFRVVGFSQDEYQTAVGDTLRFTVEIENAHNFETGEDNFTIVIQDSVEEYTLNMTVTDVNEDATSITFDWWTWHSGIDAANGVPWPAPPIAGAGFGDVRVNHETVFEEGTFPIHEDLYFAQVFPDEDANEPRVDTTNMRLVEGEVGELETFIGPKGEVDLSTDSRDDLENIMTDFDDVANEDLVVLRVEATGLYNYMGASITTGDRTAREFDRAHWSGASTSFEAEFVETTDARYENPDTIAFNETDGAVGVYHGEGHMTPDSPAYIYIAIDTENVANGDLEPGQEWEATFAVDSPVHDEVERTTSFTVLERSLEFDVVEDSYQVAPTADSEIHLSTTLAPGTQVDGDIDFRPVDRIVTESEVVVNEDGEREVVFTEDLSEFEDHIDEELTLRASATDANAEVTAVWSGTPEHETITEQERLEQQITELEDQLSEVEEQNVELQIQVGDLEEERDALQAQVDGLRSQVEDLESQNEELQSENEQLQSDLESAESERDEAQAENDEWSEAAGEDISSPQELEEFMADAQPGFGPIAALIALLAGGALMARRRL